MSKNEMMTTGSYTALKDFDLAEAMNTELGGMRLTFDHVTIPVGGGNAFEVPGENPGDTDMVKEFTGVILYHHPLLSYYKDSYDGGKNPPDCSSMDGVTGIGAPGGPCARCPLAVFGSGVNGGKACKDKRRLYVLREGELIPLLLTLPTGSMKDFGVYVKRLLAKGKKSSRVVTRFSLRKAQNAKGVAYSVAQFAVDRALEADEIPYVDTMAAQIRELAMRAAYEDNGPAEGVDPMTGEILDDPF